MIGARASEDTSLAGFEHAVYGSTAVGLGAQARARYETRHTYCSDPRPKKTVPKLIPDKSPIWQQEPSKSIAHGYRQNISRPGKSFHC